MWLGAMGGCPAEGWGEEAGQKGVFFFQKRRAKRTQNRLAFIPSDKRTMNIQAQTSFFLKKNRHQNAGINPTVLFNLIAAVWKTPSTSKLIAKKAFPNDCISNPPNNITQGVYSEKKSKLQKCSKNFQELCAKSHTLSLETIVMPFRRSEPWGSINAQLA